MLQETVKLNLVSSYPHSKYSTRAVVEELLWVVEVPTEFPNGSFSRLTGVA